MSSSAAQVTLLHLVWGCMMTVASLAAASQSGSAASCEVLSREPRWQHPPLLLQHLPALWQLLNPFKPISCCVNGDSFHMPVSGSDNEDHNAYKIPVMYVPSRCQKTSRHYFFTAFNSLETCQSRNILNLGLQLPLKINRLWQHASSFLPNSGFLSF